MGLIDIKDIPDSLLSLIRARFEREKHVNDLRILQDQCLRSGQLEKSLDIARQIEVLFAETVRMHLDAEKKKNETFDTETMDIPRADKDRMNELLVVLFMCSDIIESSIMDLNDVLHKSRKDLDITIFNDINESMKLAKEKMKYFSHIGDYMKDLTWGDQCDNMFELLKNKAKSILRKRKETGDNWGKNAEKLMKK